MKYVYLLKSGEYFKIGIAKNVASRLSSIRSSNPHGVFLIFKALVEDARKIEKSLHEKFYKQHVDGEWFLLTENEMNDVIEELKSLKVLNKRIKRTERMKKWRHKRKVAFQE